MHCWPPHRTVCARRRQQAGTLVDVARNVLEFIAKLLCGATPKVIAEEICLIRVVRVPAKQVNTGQLAGISSIQEGAGFHDLDLDVDVQVILELSLDVLSHHIRIGR